MIELPCAVEKLEPTAKPSGALSPDAFWYRQQNTNTTETVFRETMRWLEKTPEKFFLWLDTFDPHEPWDAPQRYLDQYPGTSRGQGFLAVFRQGRRYPAADLENMGASTKPKSARRISGSDNCGGTCEKTICSKTQAVIFCSDNGYYFGEHGMLGKPLKEPVRAATTIYEELGHIRCWCAIRRCIGAGQTMSGLCQPPDLFAPHWTGGHSKSSMGTGQFSLPRLNGQPGKQRLCVGGFIRTRAR